MAISNGNKFGEAYVQILAKFDQLEKQLDEVKRKTEKSAEKAGKSAGGKFEKNFTAMIGKIGLALGTAFAAGKLKSWLTDLANAQDQIQKLSIRLGESTNFLSEMQYAADLSGISAEELSSAIERANRNLAEFAETGTGEAADAFRQLGIDAKNSEGKLKSFEELLPEYADKIGQIEDSATKVNLAFKLFGRSGTSMLQILDAGKEGIQAMREEAQKLGISLDRDAVDKTAEMNDTVTRLNYALRGMGYELLAVAGKPVATLVTALTELVAGIRQVVDAWTDAATWQFLASKSGLEFIKDFAKAFVTDDVLKAYTMNQRVANAFAHATIENLEAIKTFYEQVDKLKKKAEQQGSVGSSGSGSDVVGRSRKVILGDEIAKQNIVKNSAIWRDYIKNIKTVEAEYFNLIDVYDQFQDREAEFLEMLREDTQYLIDSGNVIFESLVAGFETMFDDMIRIQTSSNNTLIKGFTAMANAFVQQVQRMIVQWLALKAVQGLLNMVVPGSGDMFASVMQKGMATGGEFFVPPGYPNDSFIMGLSSGERVQVTPSGQPNNQEKLLMKMINRLDMIASYAGVPTGLQTVNIQGRIDGYDIKLAYDRMNKLMDKMT